MQLVLQSMNRSETQRVFRPARLLLFRFRCSAIWPPLGGTVARCRTAAWVAPTSSRGATAGLSGCCGAAPAADRPASGRRPQVRGVAAAKAKPRGELPVRRRRRLERTEGLDRRNGSREGRLGEAPSRRADGITHAQRTSAAVRRVVDCRAESVSNVCFNLFQRMF
jgi:hypothetical protein